MSIWTVDVIRAPRNSPAVGCGAKRNGGGGLVEMPAVFMQDTLNEALTGMLNCTCVLEPTSKGAKAAGLFILTIPLIEADELGYQMPQPRAWVEQLMDDPPELAAYD